MFFIKNCTQIFMTLTNFLISENKNTDYVTKQRFCKCYKVYEDYIKFDTGQAEKTKSAER